MSRLVVISNRLADPRKPAAGGLAVALGEALKQTGGLWFGWSGTVVEGGTPGEGELHTRQAGAVTLATVDLCREDHDSYYHGYSNSVLWPVFHYRLDLADFNARYIAGYRRVSYEIDRFVRWQNTMYQQVARAKARWPKRIQVVEFESLCNNYEQELAALKAFIPATLDQLEQQRFVPERSRKYTGQWKTRAPWLGKQFDRFTCFNGK